jgi:hypothetical protein
MERGSEAGEDGYAASALVASVYAADRISRSIRELRDEVSNGQYRSPIDVITIV